MGNKPEQVVGLGLESSCDETSAAVVIDGRKILSNRIYSQIELHCGYDHQTTGRRDRRDREGVLHTRDHQTADHHVRRGRGRTVDREAVEMELREAAV